MTIAARTVELKLVHAPDGAELDLSSLQGLWTEQQYLRLTDQTNVRIEFTDGVLEMLPVPTSKHQTIMEFLYVAFLFWLRPTGVVHVSGLNVRIREGRFRQPDLLLLGDRNDPRNQDDFWRGADLVGEVVSPDDPARDTVAKRAEYAEAGIPEYWIVNPLEETITVLTLAGATYAEHGVFRRGEQATSALLPGFAVDVASVFDAA